jgi:hypothetical protein
MDDDSSSTDDGTFYMCFEDWAREFNQLYVLKLYPDEGNQSWIRSTMKGKWTPDTAGGCANNATWTKVISSIPPITLLILY